MGLFDHLFKTKSPAGGEKNVETAAKPGESPCADPSVFLHPKDFVRPSSIVPATAPSQASAARYPERRSGLAAPVAPPEEIVLTLGDVLSRIPTSYLKAGQHDPKRELRFKIGDLSSDIARGRAAVALSRIAQLVPDIFAKSVSRSEDTAIRLPLQKLVEQIGLLRSRPAVPVAEKNHRTPAALPGPAAALTELKTSLAALLAQPTEAPASVVLESVPPAPEEKIELKPEFAPLPVVEEKVAPAPTLLAEPLSPAAEPETIQPPRDPVEWPKPRAERAEQSNSIAAPAASVAPPAAPVEAPAALTAEPTQALAEVVPPPSEPNVTRSAPPAETPPAPAEVEPFDVDVGGEKIQLSLAAILRNCPIELIVGEVPDVPDNVRITLPFAPIDRQLVSGLVEVSALHFIAALPERYQPSFTARPGINVPIPLEEVFQNLPAPLAEPSARPHAGPLHVLAPASVAPQPLRVLAPPPIRAVESPAPFAESAVIKIEFPDFGEAALTDQTEEHSEPLPLVELVLPEATVGETPAADLAPVEPASAETVPADRPSYYVYTAPATETAPILSQPPTEQPAEISPEPPAEPPPLPTPPAAIVAEAPAPNAPPPAVAPPPPPLPMTEDSPPPAAEQFPALDLVATAAAQPAEELKPATDFSTTPPPPQTFGGEATHTIGPPQMFRPVIVLPPPIVGYTPPPAEEKPSGAELKSEQVALAPALAGEPAQNREVSPPMEAAPAGEAAARIEAAATATETATVEATPAPILAPITDSSPGVHVVPAAPAGEKIPPPPVAPQVDEPAAVASTATTIEAVVMPKDAVEPEAAKSITPPEAPTVTTSAPPAPLAESPVEKPAPVPTVVKPVERAPVPPEVKSTLPTPAPPQARPTPPIVTSPVGMFSEMLRGEQPAAEFMPSWRVGPEVTPFPSSPHMVIEPPVATPAPPPKPSPVLPPVIAEPVAAAEAVEQIEESTPPAAADTTPKPLLHVPDFTLEPPVDEILPPPALPLQRFDQDALQAIFLTDETLDLAKISRLAAQLPGVHACVIATRDQACTGGTLPEGFDLAALLGLAPRVGEAAGRLPIGGLKHFTLYGEQYSVSFFERAGLSLCAVHRPRSFVPGVREKLVAIADELSKS